MKASTHIKTALTNLVYSPLRSVLAMLGCMIGTASVVALLSSGNLAADKSLEYFKSLGTDQMSIMIMEDAKKEKSKLKITAELLMLMKTAVPEIKILTPYSTNYMGVSYQDVTVQANIISSTETLAQSINILMQEGRFFASFDKDSKFCVLGNAIAKKFYILDILGKRLRVGTIICTVIGIAAPWPENSFFTNDVNMSIITTLNFANLFKQPQPIRNMVLKLQTDADIDSVKAKINNFFTKYIPGYSTNIQSAKELVKNMLGQQQTFTLLLGFIGGISLLVAGIGIMNLMLASVAERHYEIALRIAIGAQPKDIQMMFLSESVILAAIGGGIGVLIGEIATFIIAVYSGWTFSVFVTPPLLGFIFSILISMFFGFYPAYVASKLNPIDILHAS